jgi:CYTH domain-containing protein
MEVERKFLLSERPPGLESHPAKRVEQGYVALDGAVEVRVRRNDGADATLTVKSGGGLARVEEEVDLALARFDGLWPLTEGRRVVKTRYRVPLGEGLTAEVDDYEGDLRGLLTAEVEFDSEASAEAFAPPAWLGAEVTGDPRYANRALAVDGLP